MIPKAVPTATLMVAISFLGGASAQLRRAQIQIARPIPSNVQISRPTAKPTRKPNRNIKPANDAQFQSTNIARPVTQNTQIPPIPNKTTDQTGDQYNPTRPPLQPAQIDQTGDQYNPTRPPLQPSQCSKDPPLKIARNKGDAKSDLPEAEIELARFYNKDVTIEMDKSTGAYVVKGRFDMKRYEAPRIPLTLLDRKSIGDIDDDCGLTGMAPDHLDFNAKPQQIRDFMNIKLKEGEDRPISVFGDDDRYTYRDTDYPWSTVGRIVNDSGGVCTGTSIGSRLVLTAAHCVNFYDGSVGAVSFTPGYYNGDAPFGVYHTERAIYWMRVEGPGLSNEETAFDYIVLVMSAHVGRVTGYAGYRTYNSSWNGGNYWQNMGYPGGMTGTLRPVFSGSGAIETVEDHETSGQTGYVLGNYIDIEGGHSGGPVWGWWSGENFPRVVGDMSAESGSPSMSEAGDNEAGGGPALTALLNWSRTNYP